MTRQGLATALDVSRRSVDMYLDPNARALPSLVSVYRLPPAVLRHLLADIVAAALPAPAVLTESALPELGIEGVARWASAITRLQKGDLLQALRELRAHRDAAEKLELHIMNRLSGREAP